MKRVALALGIYVIAGTAYADPPVADAGPDRDAEVGSSVSLSGSGSSDPDGDELSYEWRIISAPSGAGSSLSGDSSEVTELTPDVAGPWRIELTVSDGSDTDTDEVEVTAYDPGGEPDPGTGGNGDPNGGAYAHRGSCDVGGGDASGVLACALALAGFLVPTRRRRS